MRETYSRLRSLSSSQARSMDRVNPEGEVIAWRWPKDVEGTFPRIHMLATMNTERTVLSRLPSGVPILRLLPVVT